MKRRLMMIGWMVAGLAAGLWAADELTVSQGWTYSKAGRSRVLSVSGVKHDIAGNGAIDNIQSIATNGPGTALVLGGVTTPGFAWFKNLSTTNYVEIGTSDTTNFTAFLKLNTNESATCWLSTTAPYARANLVAVRLDYMILDR